MTAGALSIGLSTVTLGLAAQPAASRRALLSEAAATGIDHLHVGDHVTFRGGQGFDGLIAASTLLALQDALPVHVGAYLLPLRHPTVVARQLADLWAHHPGRLVLAVGLGGDDPAELEACGVDPRTRGARMDEALAALRGLLAGGPVSTAGRFVTLDAVRVSPAAPELPVLVAGRSDAALRRVARLGDGWLAIWVSARRFAAAVATIADAAEPSSRAASATRHGLVVWCAFGEDRARTERRRDDAMRRLYGVDPAVFARWCPVGTPETVAEFLAPYVAAGARDISLLPAGADPLGDNAAVGRVRELLRQHPHGRPVAAAGV